MSFPMNFPFLARSLCGVVVGFVTVTSLMVSVVSILRSFGWLGWSGSSVDFVVSFGSYVGFSVSALRFVLLFLLGTSVSSFFAPPSCGPTGVLGPGMVSFSGSSLSSLGFFGVVLPMLLFGLLVGITNGSRLAVSSAMLPVHLWDIFALFGAFSLKFSVLVFRMNLTSDVSATIGFSPSSFVVLGVF